MADPYHDLLEALAEDLRENGLDAFVKLGGGALPDQLFVPLDPDEKGRSSHLQMMFLPGMDEVPILQTYVGLPYEVLDDSFEELAKFLLSVNVTMPLGAFGFVEEQRLCYFRYNAATPVDPLDVDVTTWAMALASHVIERVGPLVESVALGRPARDAEADLLAVITAEAGGGDDDDDDDEGESLGEPASP